MFIDLTSISFSTGYVFAKHIINTIWYSEASVQRYSVKSVFCRKGKENVKNRTLTNFGTRLRHRSYTWTKKDTSVFSCKFYFFFFFKTATLEKTFASYFWVLTNVNKVLAHLRKRLPIFKKDKINISFRFCMLKANIFTDDLWPFHRNSPNCS